MYIKKILNNAFFKKVMILTSGTALVQLIGILVTPIITRMYSPDEYGIMVLYLSILGMISIVASFKYEQSIVIARNDRIAKNIFILCLLIVFLFSSMVGIIVFILDVFSINYGLPNYLSYLIPLGVLIMGINQIMYQWSIRKENFKGITLAKVNQSLISNTLKLLLGLFNVGVLGLILSTLVGNIRGLKYLVPVDAFKEILKAYKKKYLIYALSRYRKFALYLAPSQVLNASGIHLPIIFLTFMYGNITAGAFGLANTILNIPMSLIGNSIGDVFYSEASKIGNKSPQKLKELSNKLLIKLMFLGLLIVLPVVLFGVELFVFAFGEPWELAGELATILVIMIYFRLIFAPISRVFEVYERQKQILFLDMFRSILVIGSFIIAHRMDFSVEITIVTYVLSMSLIYFITFIYAQYLIRKKIRENKIVIVKN